MGPRPVLHALLSFGPFEPLARRLSVIASLGLRIRTCGRRRAARRGPLVVASTHPGPVDLTTLDVALGRPLDIVLDDALLAIPVFGRILRIRGAHPLRNVGVGGDEGNAAALAGAAAAARAGRAVVIFPEGEHHGFGAGAARIAAAARAPVLPVTIYPVGGEGAPLRRLAVIGRPLRPPEDDPRARREFMRRLRRHHVGGELRDALSMALDDSRLWRHPPSVVRLAGRVARFGEEQKRRFLRAARALRRGCAAAGCAVGDLREPPGARDLARYLALLAPAGAGILLCAPALLALRLACARFGKDRRAARMGIGIALAGPYGLALAAAGLALLGAPGLLLPLVAVSGLCCAGLARPLHHRVLRIPRVRRAGPRLRRLLEAFDRATYAERLSTPLRTRVA